MKNLIYKILVFSLISACSHREAKKPKTYPTESPKITTTKPDKTDVTTDMLASEQGSDLVAEVKFKKGSSVLTGDAKKKIKNLYGKASKEDQDIDEVQLVSWADTEYPEQEGKVLPDWEQKLAEKRNDALERALKGLDSSLEFKKISMAEKTSRFKALTSPGSAEIKESMEESEIGTKNAADETKVSRGIVIFILKKQ